MHTLADALRPPPGSRGYLCCYLVPVRGSSLQDGPWATYVTESPVAPGLVSCKQEGLRCLLH